MSEHHRGAWGAREDALWWPSALTTDYQQSLQQTHQHLLSQHQAATNQHLDAARSTSAASVTQQLFSYKMANSFQTNANLSATSSPVASCMRAYDYSRLGDVPGSRSSDVGPLSPNQWWYSGLGGPIHNVSSPSVPQHRGRMPRGKADAKPRGRMTAYAFFVQTCREEHKKKHPDENVIFAEFSKKCSERWKTMVDKEKKRFHEMAERDKKRYDTEMESYTPAKGEKTRGKKRKHIKDPNAPKRALSAFFWFSNDERSKVKGANPEFSVGEIAKELGRRWADCSPDVKSKYEAMAEKDKARYEREMTAYKKRTKTGGAAAEPKKPDSEEEDEEDEDDDDEADGDE